MLVEFRAENHRSLREEQVLSLESVGGVARSDGRPRQVVGHDKPLLPVAAIYGANASGKTNVLSAMFFMREAVLISHAFWDYEGGVPRVPFHWGPQRNEPSLYELVFLQNGTKYQYGFVVDDVRVQEEWLYAWPRNRRQVWFEREQEDIKFGPQFTGPNESLRERTRQNSLCLTVAAQDNHPKVQAIYAWFKSIAPINLGTDVYTVPSFQKRFALESILHDQPEPLEAMVKPIRRLLRIADVGVRDIKFVKDDRAKELPFPGFRVLCQHEHGEEEAWLEYHDESKGTQTLLRIAEPLFRVFTSGSLMLIDELEASLHPALAAAVVKMFNNPETNPQNAQLIFTTHDTNLLGTTSGAPPLRRDQIWFTEKDDSGATRLYPLTDYKPRKAENLERGYLQGRYGAIPFLGDLTKMTE